MLNNFKNNKKRIFCYLNGLHHLRLFYPIFSECTQFDFYIYSPKILKNDFIRDECYFLKNVYFIENIKKALPKIPAFGTMITTDAQLCSPHLDSIKLIYIFKVLHIPVFELQHGLFQIGLSYENDVKHFGPQSDSFSLNTCADYFLSYYGEDTETQFNIGYPEMWYKNVKRYSGKYILILSNLHWDAYADSERSLFYHIILEYVKLNRDKKFIWKLHHGEEVRKNGDKTIIEYINSEIENSNISNLLIYNTQPFFKFVKLEELIAKCEFVISTVSTVLLLCEKYNKRTFIYNALNLECLTKKLKKVNLFNSYISLVDLISNSKITINTSFLNSFNSKKIVDILEKKYHLTSLSSQDCLKFFI